MLKTSSTVCLHGEYCFTDEHMAPVGAQIVTFWNDRRWDFCVCSVVKSQKAKSVLKAKFVCLKFQKFLNSWIFLSFCFSRCKYGCNSDSPVYWSPRQLWCECRRAPARWVSRLKAEPTHASPCHASSPYKCVTSHARTHYIPSGRKITGEMN